MKKTLLTLAIVFVSSLGAMSQTVGLLSFDETKAQDGYNLYFPHRQGNVFLLDNCGRLVHQWEDTIYNPGNSVFLSEDGLLYAAKGRGGLSNEYIHAGGGGELLEIRNFDDEILWQWFYNDSTKRLHHDYTVMPNGNILAIAWERFNMEDCIQAGRDSENLPDGELWPDHIIEIEPVYPDGANIVWEWHAWDHMVQEFDETKDNYGVVADHPELIDINFTPDGVADWHHMNAIDYNPFLDQIVMSVPTFNEMWIIDHSTTTQQAAGHSGGLSGMGGDLIFRWGNPMAYQAGDTLDQKLFYQHDTHWLDVELGTGDPDFGKIGFFNNRVGDDFSSVGIINAVFDSYESGYELENGQFLPEDYDWEYTTPEPTDMWSTGLSGMQKLPNENILICVGRFGYNFEITPDEEIVWEYVNPLLGGEPVAQGTELGINDNIMFRMLRFSPDYAGFDGQTFSPMGYIELEPDMDFVCPIVSVDELSNEQLSQIKAFPNPTDGRLNISVNQDWGRIQKVDIHNAQGQLMFNKETTINDYLLDIDVADYAAGVYVFTVTSEDGLAVRRSFIKE